MLVAAGTLYDWTNNGQSSMVVFRFLMCFSLLKAFKMLFNMRDRKLSDKSPKWSLEPLDGMRVFLIVWIIVSHSCSMAQVPRLMKVSPYAQYPDGMNRLGNRNYLASAFVQTLNFSVSIFFMIRCTFRKSIHFT